MFNGNKMDNKEFADIVNSTKHVVLSAVKKHIDPRYDHSIDDIVQETYLRAYKALMKNSFRGDSSIDTWIYTIARNETMRMMKKLNREAVKLRKKADSLENSVENTIFEDVADYNINKLDLEGSIGSLPGKYKEVMELIILGFSEKQIAVELSLKKGTVKSRIFRGRALLHRTLSGETKYV
jgi:RNA polymerase sigma-70 factor, ECF subfamily